MSVDNVPDPSFDQMMDAAFPAEPAPAAAPGTAPPASPPGQSATTDSGAPASQPGTLASPAAAAPERRLFKVKLDSEEHEIDLDEHWKDEAKRAKLRELVEKGYGFDRRVERARQEAAAQGIQRAEQWLRAQGYDFQKLPDGSVQLIPPQAANPAPATPPQGPAIGRAELEKLADDGDVKAIRELARLDAEAARQAAEAKFEARFTAQAKAEQEARRKAHEAQAEQFVREQVRETYKARAKSFENLPPSHLARLETLALLRARGQDGQPAPGSMAEVLAIVTEEADALDQRQQAFLKTLAAQPRAPTPPPVLDGTPPGAASAPLSGTPSLSDDYMDAALEASAPPRR